jgi:hypothetical protein
LATVLLATPVVPEPEARAHVWVNLAPTILGLVGVPRGPAAALGASVAVTPALWLTLETTFFGFPSESLCATKGTVFWNAVGVSIRPFEIRLHAVEAPLRRHRGWRRCGGLLQLRDTDGAPAADDPAQAHGRLAAAGRDLLRSSFTFSRGTSR